MRTTTSRARRAASMSAAVLSIAIVSAAQAATPSRPTIRPAHEAAAWQAKTHPVFMRTIGTQWDRSARSQATTPPTPPCPESGKLPGPFSNCGLPQFPAVGQPYAGNMAYWGGHVQVSPKIYLVLWGWGRRGAFDAACARQRIIELTIRVTLRCDPDGVGRRMADFLSQLGGTAWAGVQSQYFEGTGKQRHITNPKHQLAGIWVDDSSNLNKNKRHLAPAGPAGALGTADDGGGIYRQFAQEAARAVAHFHVTDLKNANIVIAQPQNYSDPQAASVGYCAFHDYTEPILENGWYNGIKPGISYTNMPYVLSQGDNCGAHLVNSGTIGKLDGVTIALGHEVEETITDPDAEDILPNGQVLGGWYDPFDANENGDKCAYVGLIPFIGGSTGEPGSANNIRGNRGTRFPVQSLWSNAAAAGVGYCAGAGNDVPL